MAARDSPVRCAGVEVVVAVGAQQEPRGGQRAGGRPAVGVCRGLSEGHWVRESGRRGVSVSVALSSRRGACLLPLPTAAQDMDAGELWAPEGLVCRARPDTEADTVSGERPLAQRLKPTLRWKGLGSHFHPHVPTPPAAQRWWTTGCPGLTARTAHRGSRGVPPLLTATRTGVGSSPQIPMLEA